MILIMEANKNVTQMGNAALNPAEHEAWQFSSESYIKPDDRGDVGQYEYDRALSDDNTAVWHNHTARLTHVSHRGSTTAYDWGVSDAQVGLGLESHGARFKKSVKKTNDAHEQHGYDVTSSGHSLGGSVTSHVTEQLGNNAWYRGGTTFNSGVSQLGQGSSLSSHRRVCNRTDAPAYCSKITHLKERGDLVSNRNIACDTATFGMAPEFCTKRDPFGNTRVYDHTGPKPRHHRYIPGSFIYDRTNTHSLLNFVSV